MFPAPGEYAREANARIDAMADDARYQRIAALESLWTGRAWDGRPSFWDNTVPLRDRRPAIQSMLPRTAGRRLVALVFGERTFPSVTVERTSFGVTLTDDEAEALSALVIDVIGAKGSPRTLRTRMRAVMEAGLKCGSACAIVSIVAGRPHVAVEPAKHCYPTLRADGSVERLVVEYKTPTPGGKPGEFSWYRREIADGFDRVYPLQPCESERRPDWTAAEAVSVTAVPFVPVVWVRNLAEAEEESCSVDGHALAEGLEDEVLALDLALSQLHRNALYNGDPQMVQIGVSVGDGAQSMQAPRGPVASTTEWATGWVSRIFGSSGTAAKKGPGQIWKLPPQGDAKLLESTGAGAQIIRGNVDELRRVVSDAIGVILADPETFGRGDLSAKSLELMLGPMLDTAGTLRAEYGGALLAIVDTVLRLCADEKIGRGVYLPTIDAARPVLAKLYAPREDGTVAWLGAPLALAWPDMVEPSWGDVSAAINAAHKATGGRPVLSQRAALRMVAPVAGVDDLDAEATEIAREMGADAETMRGVMQPETATPVAPETAVQDTALNGAQVSSMLEVATAVSAGTLPLDTAVAIVVRAFQLTPEAARAMLAPAAEMGAGRRVVPPTPPAQPAPNDAPPAAE